MCRKQTIYSTIVNRHCRDCSYYDKLWKNPRIGWCYWLGTYCVGSSYECEDGFRERVYINYKNYG